MLTINREHKSREHKAVGVSMEKFSAKHGLEGRGNENAHDETERSSESEFGTSPRSHSKCPLSPNEAAARSRIRRTANVNPKDRVEKSISTLTPSQNRLGVGA